MEHRDDRVRAGRRWRGRTALWLAGLLLAGVLGCSREEEPQPAAAAAAPKGPPAEITTPSGVQMVLVPGGEFTMGDGGGADDEKPPHKVRVSPFYMDKFEVTQKSYQELMGTNPSKFKQPDRPVEQVSWFNAVKYCNMRSLREGLTPCYDLKTLRCDPGADGYRLPTEAEWEYACRAGTQSDYSFSGGPSRLVAYGWFKANAQGSSQPVGQKRPNPWGLYDMHGNVAEWCHDVYDEGYYARSPAEDPMGPADGDERVLRGGSWAVDADACRSSARYSDTPGFADVCFGYDAYGFRAVRRASGDAE